MRSRATSSPVRRAGTVSFSNIPKTTALFSDYLYAPDRVARFYERPWEGVGGLERLAPEIAASARERERVANALEKQNRGFGSGSRTFEHIEMLRRPDAVAIVTGQQAGLFGGPLFTVYKALTAVLLAEQLRERGVAAVPVFWVASEDHDFDEVNHVTVATGDVELETIRLEPCNYEPDRPVGNVSLCAEIGHTIDQFFAALPRTLFTDELRADLAAAYAPGSGFADGFSRLMAKLFEPFGVVLLDPLMPELKDLAAPTYIAAIERADEISRALVDRSKELVDAGYHAQVHTSTDMVPLFILDGDHRRAMVHRDGRFELKSGEHVYSTEDLIAYAGDCPTCLSPNVTLRPAVQDTLLPTLAYVGGPAEVAYFAQLQPVYRIVGRPMPVIVPRASATLVDHESAKTLERYGLALADFFDGAEPLLRRAVENSPAAPTAAKFDETEQELERHLEDLRAALAEVDPTLAESLDGGRRKMLYQLEKLRMRFTRATAERDETLKRRVEAAATLLHPSRGFQERTLNVYSYLVEMGYGFVVDLASALDPELREHQVIELGGVPSQIFVADEGA
jgi:bacillithiol biosynthesis cysteine-adding enzyme BshC